MEEKSKRYDRMKRGDYSGISEAEMAEMLFEVCDLTLDITVKLN